MWDSLHYVKGKVYTLFKCCGSRMLDRISFLWYLIFTSNNFIKIDKVQANGFNPPGFDKEQRTRFYSLVCSASSTIVGEDSYLLLVHFWEDLSNWQLFRTYRIGANSEFELGDRRELDFTYRATVE